MRRYVVNTKLGKRLKKARKERKITQEKLAEKLNMHETTISRIETGAINPPVQTVNRIARALKISLSDLF